MRLFILTLLIAAALRLAAEDVRWRHLSSSRGELPVPGESNQQTAALAADLDRDGVNDFVLGFRQKGSALVWFRPQNGRWSRQVIEPEFLGLDAGGAACDIDGDGDLDVVFGPDGRGILWWWENPFPDFSDPWKRHIVAETGAKQFHDQLCADVIGAGRPQLVFWNQQSKSLWLAQLPANPTIASNWKRQLIYTDTSTSQPEGAASYVEGLDAFDIDGDGKRDLLAGNAWFRYSGGTFRRVEVARAGGRIRAGRFQPGRAAQIVIAPGDGTGRVMLYTCDGDPAEPGCWTGRDLLGRDVVHGHTLELGDVNRDGNLDIFVAEMAQWSSRAPEPNHPKATAWILYGNGKGAFRTSVVSEGHGWHEGRLADFNGDGLLDMLNKPYTWQSPRVDLWLNLGPGGRGAAKVAPLVRWPVGVQLYSLRDELTRDLPATLRRLRAAGVEHIETNNFYGRSADEFRELLDRTGVRCSSFMANFAKLSGSFEQVVRDARTAGADYVVTASFPRSKPPTAAECRAAARNFNRFGLELRKRGLRFAYHPHGFEFVPAGRGVLLDILLGETDPVLVDFEMDIYWFAQAGANPADWLRRYGKRFALLHLKDMAHGTLVGPNAPLPGPESSSPLGTGVLNLPEILAAARSAPIRMAYLEDESSQGWSHVRAGLRYLKGESAW